jgi:hypothetical protein
VTRHPTLFLALLVLAGCATAPAVGPQQFVVYFETGADTLTPEAREVVGSAADAARAHPPGKITVEGHADGGTANDAALADKRALAVIAALSGDGVDANAIEKIPGAPAAGAAGVAAHQAIIGLIPQASAQ